MAEHLQRPERIDQPTPWQLDDPGCGAPRTATRPVMRVGWRADLVGEPIRALVDGEASLAFDRDGSLRLEARSRQPLV